MALSSSLGIGLIARVPVGGGPQTTLATGRTLGIDGIAGDDSNVYWLEGDGAIEQGAVAALPKSGGQVAILASGLGDPSAIAVDDTAVYFIASGNIEKIAKGALRPGALPETVLDPGNPIRFIQGRASPDGAFAHERIFCSASMT